MASAAGVIGSKGSAAGGGLGSCGVSRSLNGMYLVPATGLSLKVTLSLMEHLKRNLQQYLVLD